MYVANVVYTRFLPITCRGPSSGTVDFAVGNGDAVGGTVAQNDVLTGNKVGGYVVNPDKVTAVNGNGISTPHVLRVDIGEADVLNNDVLYAVCHPDALSFDDTLGALADETLVRADSHTSHTSLVVLDAGDLGSVLLIVVAPSVLVDSDLAATAGAPWTASSGRCGTLGTSEVESLCKNNDSR
jgi:hypothetical protein